LVAAASLTNKVVNQDACGVVLNEKARLSAIVVADGLGSHYGAEIASRIAVDTAARYLQAIESPSDLDLDRVFSAARHAIDNYASQDGLATPPDLDWDNAFGTTLLCAVETRDLITVGYLGNGGIFHIRGDFQSFPKNQLLPWTAINYLNPHSAPRDGKNVLYKLLSPRRKGPETVPAILTFRKDNEFLGDLVMICSDGIYSYDQTPIGKDAEDRVWISGERAICMFFEFLGGFFSGEEYTAAELETTLHSYLAGLRLENLVTDDCTLAVLIGDQAIRRQRALLAHAKAAV